MKTQSLRPQWVGICLALALFALALQGCGASDDGAADAPPDGRSPAAARVSKSHPCRGMSPLEAARHYEREVRDAGASKRFLELVTDPTPAVESSPGFPRVVAAFYATTLPPDQRAAAATACAKELVAK